jgi:hypothetical protein
MMFLTDKYSLLTMGFIGTRNAQLNVSLTFLPKLFVIISQTKEGREGKGIFFNALIMKSFTGIFLGKGSERRISER